ncbi:MAG: restriction endonuclease [Oscillibacter sp.]|nr:restriction endonuclease [Oscillibacter sp.]MBD5155736.1 restriction endonuclease [Oscillibacter sp.]
MTPQELKNSILQLAIQGKLVEQRPEEGTAEELYQQIQAKKQRLVKGGKLKREKPLPEIAEDEVPFEIPGNWKWVHLFEIGHTQTGNTPSKSHPEYIGEDIPFITPGDIFCGCISYNNQALSNLGKTVARTCNSNSILQVCIGGSIGKAAVTNQEVAFNQQINSISPIYCNSQYIYSVIISHYFTAKMKKVAGGTATPIINRGLWDKLLIPLPPLAEQKRIVAKIEELLPYIDRYEQAWSRLEAFNKRFPSDMQKSLLQMAIQGTLVEQKPEEGTAEDLYQQIQVEKRRLVKEGKIKKEKPLPEIAEDEVPFEIPESWKWCRWGDLSNTIQYGYNASAQISGRIKMVRISDIQDGNVQWDMVPFCDIDEEEIPIYLLQKDDILFARTGGTVGKSYLVKDVPEESIYAGYLIRTRYSENLCPEYMKAFMESQLYWTQLRNGTIATAQPNCNGKTLAKMVLPLPPLAEQKRIVAKLEKLLPLCERLK